MIWTIIQLVISGIAMGFVYALIGIEYTLIYNASGVLNFSHDKMVSLGAYIYAGMFVLGLGWNSVVSAIASLLLMAVFGILVAYLIFIPLRKQKSMIFTIMATIMFGKVIMEGACLIWGGNAFTIPDFMSGTYQIGNAVISKSNLFLIIAAIVIVALLQFYLQKTKPGKAMRCVAQNKTAAAIMGIDIDRSINITTGLSCVICGIIGVLTIPLFTISLTMSNMIGLKGWAAGIVGGFGYIPGTILGGLLIGVVESLAILVIPTVYKDIVAFVFLIVVLLIRPGGFMRHKV